MFNLHNIFKNYLIYKMPDYYILTANKYTHITNMQINCNYVKIYMLNKYTIYIYANVDTHIKRDE